MTDIRTALEPSPADLDRLSHRLAEAADASGELDIAICEADSPVGPLLLAATPVGLVRLAFTTEDTESVLADLAVRVSPRILRAPRRLDRTRKELEEYFAGRRTGFAVPLDRRLSSGFRDEAQRRLLEIPYGTTITYAALAARSGRPTAVRAAAGACAANPVPIVVPCHRVVRTDGSPGGYRGGVDAKRWILAFEEAHARRSEVASTP